MLRRAITTTARINVTITALPTITTGNRGTIVADLIATAIAIAARTVITSEPRIGTNIPAALTAFTARARAAWR
jgi:hypothetical protein